MKARRLMILIGIILVCSWAAVMSWRAYGFHRESRALLLASWDFSREEQKLVNYAREADSRVDLIRQELAELHRRLATSTLTREQRDESKRLAEMKAFIIDTDAQYAKNCRTKASELAAKSRAYEALARQYGSASIRPWTSPSTGR